MFIRLNYNKVRNMLQEVLFQFFITGNYVKVIAVDPNTNTEISIVGDRRLSKTVLQRNAIKKLQYVIEKRNQKENNKFHGDLV